MYLLITINEQQAVSPGSKLNFKSLLLLRAGNVGLMKYNYLVHIIRSKISKEERPTSWANASKGSHRQPIICVRFKFLCQRARERGKQRKSGRTRLVVSLPKKIRCEEERVIRSGVLFTTHDFGVINCKVPERDAQRESSVNYWPLPILAGFASRP